MLDNLKSANLKRWQAMKVNGNAVTSLDKVAARLIAAKARYQEVEAQTNVPWCVIAVIHEREASQSWFANLAQGDPWDKVSTHVPRGQGPFSSWEEAAINALKTDKLDTWGDWSIQGTLTALEKYNGLGYNNKGRSSPYVWAKSNQYEFGKYVADGVYNPNAIDTQMGCAPLLLRMMKMDASIGLKYKWTLPTPVADTSHTKAASAVIVTAGTSTVASATHPHLWPWIAGGIVVAALVTYTWLHSKGKV